MTSSLESNNISGKTVKSLGALNPTQLADETEIAMSRLKEALGGKMKSANIVCLRWEK